ncbi:uracil-DNA glycosylase [uncultured Microbacterium sp.]|uniref:uracil-DNA glycosylase n=1 Tax=uncultured Microbacterium sp. TaxID=191216 RepID=UPI00262B8ED8|nr:uracil-DNA glycosylase [uncultured Microbacterium sp.]
MPDWSLERLVSTAQIDPSWAEALAPAAGVLADLGEQLEAEEYLPRHDRVLRVFQQPLPTARVLIIGQDPYPTPGHAIGLAFATEGDVRPLPRSLQNIYAERQSDVGIRPAPHGDLSAWSEQGVLLLNRVLTVSPAAAGSHRGRGWEHVTEAAIRALAARDQPLVAILWGKDAAAVQPLLGDTPTISSAHPSPLSARRGFFGSRPFSRTDEMLIAQGAAPIDWHVGGDDGPGFVPAALF